jgi:preprotein translocase subunit SecY
MGSSLDFLKPIIRFLPEVGAPERFPNLYERFFWTAIALLLFFSMYHIIAAGVQEKSSSADFLQIVTASRIGSLITVGIGPIILASIFLQLFAGAKIINIDLSDPEQRKTFHGAQKLLAIILCFFEASLFVISGRVALIPLFPGEGYIQEFQGGVIKEKLQAPYTTLFVIFQIALGSLILLYLDEVVSKYGIGSGISLFIAAGVSFSIIGGTVYLFTAPGGVIDSLSSGTADALPNAIMALLPLFFTFIILLIVVYAEGIKVEIPLAFEKARGFGGRFPIKFLYVSNIPVILSSAFIWNLILFSATLQNQHLCIGGTYDPSSAEKCKGGFDLIPMIAYVDSTGQVRDGLVYLFSPIFRPMQGNYGIYFSHLISGTTPIFGIPEWLHVIIYVLFNIILCIIFGMFWVETTGIGPKDVAEQLDKSGLQIPGFRRDVRIVEKKLNDYIPYIVILGSAFVGLLASVADMTGALGTGTGILLTSSIIVKFYQDLEKQRLFDNYALFSGL